MWAGEFHGEAPQNTQIFVLGGPPDSEGGAWFSSWLVDRILFGFKLERPRGIGELDPDAPIVERAGEAPPDAIMLDLEEWNLKLYTTRI